MLRCDLNFTESPDQLLFLRAQLLGSVQLDPHVQIANPRRVHSRKTSATEVKYLATLGSRGNLQCHACAYRRHLNVGAEHELRVRDEHFAVQILGISLKTRIFLDLEYDEDIPPSAPARTDIPCPAHRHVLSGRNARRNLDRYTFLLAHPSLAATLATG